MMTPVSSYQLRLMRLFIGSINQSIVPIHTKPNNFKKMGGQSPPNSILCLQRLKRL